MKTLAPVLLLAAFLAGCAIPPDVTSQAAVPHPAVSRPAASSPARRVTPAPPPAPPFAYVARIVTTCAAGADYPGQSPALRSRDFRLCLGVMEVPAVFVPCAERVFRRHEQQGAQEAGRWFRRECKTTITERKP